MIPMNDRNIQMNQLLHEVVQRLNGDFDSVQSLSLVLEQIGKAFQYAGAFIYECDHTQQLFLKEFWTVTPNIVLPAVLRPEEYLEPQQFDELHKNPLQYSGKTSGDSKLVTNLCKMFGMVSLFTVFVLDDSDSIISCIGISDQRFHPLMKEPDVLMADHLLKLVAERTRLRVYKRRLEFTSITLENIMDHAGFDIYVNDFYTHEMLYANQSMAAPYGGWDNMKGKTCHAALYEGQAEECTYCPKQYLIDEDGNPTKIYSWDYQRPFDKAWFRVICTAFRWVDGRLAQVISSADITQAKKNELLIEQMAYTDALTGIGNRLKLKNDFNRLAAEPGFMTKGITIFFVDLNKFKILNDTYGHSTGDSILQQLADVFKKDKLTADRCYRYGGDEFIFLFTGLTTEDTLKRCQELSQLLSTPLMLQGQPYTCTGSIGWARCPENGTTYEELLDLADSRMYDQKTKNRNAKSVMKDK